MLAKLVEVGRMVGLLHEHRSVDGDGYLVVSDATSYGELGTPPNSAVDAAREHASVMHEVSVGRRSKPSSEASRGWASDCASQLGESLAPLG